LNRIIQGIGKFQSDVYPANQDLFQKLASGQKPETLFIACSDSRVSLEMLTQTGPGEIFVCRNAGNIVPVYGHTGAVTAAIEYAVCALKVKEIVVKGHSDCGAMKGLLNPGALTDMLDVRAWLRHSEDALHALRTVYVDPSSPEALPALIKLNIRLQIEHLRTHPQVRAGIRAGTLRLHGWFYEIATGTVQAWDADTSRWVSVHDAYTPIEAKHEQYAEAALHA
jgi:carbonic anhydrase